MVAAPAPGVPTAVATPAIVATFAVVAVSAAVVAVLRCDNNGPGCVIRMSRRIMAVAGATQRGHATAKGEKTQEESKNEGFGFHDVGYTPQRDSYR